MKSPMNIPSRKQELQMPFLQGMSSVVCSSGDILSNVISLVNSCLKFFFG